MRMHSDLTNKMICQLGNINILNEMTWMFFKYYSLIDRKHLSVTKKNTKNSHDIWLLTSSSGNYTAKKKSYVETELIQFSKRQIHRWASQFFLHFQHSNVNFIEQSLKTFEFQLSSLPVYGSSLFPFAQPWSNLLFIC